MTEDQIRYAARRAPFARLTDQQLTNDLRDLERRAGEIRDELQRRIWIAAAARVAELSATDTTTTTTKRRGSLSGFARWMDSQKQTA